MLSIVGSRGLGGCCPLYDTRGWGGDCSSTDDHGWDRGLLSSSRPSWMGMGAVQGPTPLSFKNKLRSAKSVWKILERACWFDIGLVR